MNESDPGPGAQGLTHVLIRHADAIQDEPDWVRALSERGRGQAERLGERLRGIASFAPVEIWHSPLVRAIETSHLMVAALGRAVPEVEQDGLAPESDPRPAAARLAAQTRSIAVVGHEPNLAGIAAVLTGADPARPHFGLGKASALALHREGGRWRAEWWVRAP